MGVNASVKASIKAVLRPPIQAGWPALEYAACLLPSYSSRNLKIRWSSEWNGEFDEALNVLPELDECPHDLYRQLLASGSVPKLHALVTENGEPTTIVSLRRCLRHWETVTYQCIPKVVLPAVSPAALGRALNALGLEVRVPAGIGPEIAELNARQSWSYEWYQVRLQEDYEEHWRKKKRMYTIRRARARCAEMDIRIDGEGDLEWVVQQWREQWKDDPGQEVVATEDRLRLWSALMRAPSQAKLNIHTIVMHNGTQRVAGLVLTSMGDETMLQCGGRDPNFDDSYTAAAMHLAVIDWSANNGFKTLDMSGGAWKRHWGVVGGVRHGAYFRSPLIDAVGWAN